MDTLDEIRLAEYIERNPDSAAALHVREAAHAHSFGVFLSEFERGNASLVETPQYSRKRSTVQEVAELDMDVGPVLDLIRAAAKCNHTPLRLQAQAIVATLARRYADDVQDMTQ